MTRTLVRPFLTLLAFSIGLATWGAPSPAEAQTANVIACSIKGSVTITILGSSTTTLLSCGNRSEVNEPGDDESALVSTLSLGLPVLPEIASVKAPRSDARWTLVDAFSPLIFRAKAEAAELELIDAIHAQGVAGGLRCEAAPGGTNIACGAAVTIDNLDVLGQDIPIPAQPIPLDTSVPVSNLNVTVNVLGLPVSVPVSGSILLNKVTVTGNGTEHAQIQQATLAANLSGLVQVLGLDVGVSIDLEDYGEINFTPGEPTTIAIPIALTWDERFSE